MCPPLGVTSCVSINDVVKRDPPASSPTKNPTGTSVTQSNPLGDRAHIMNKNALDERALAGPGSLDPQKLAPPLPDARRWLAKRGVELQVPEGWRFLGIQLEGKSISFNHSGAADGHTVEVSGWQLADDTPLEKFLVPYLDEVEDLVRLGRLAGHKRMQLGDADGVLLIGWGPDDKPSLASADPEEMFLATDGTGRRTMSWRGAVRRNSGGTEESQLLIVSFNSPIETFMEARAVYDAILASTRILK